MPFAILRARSHSTGMAPILPTVRNWGSMLLNGMDAFTALFGPRLNSPSIDLMGSG